MAISGKLTKKLVENLSAGRHGDGNGLYLVVDPSGARRWIVRVVVKGQTNKKGAPLRTDFGLGGADIVPLSQARERALEYRRMAKQGFNPRFNAKQKIPTFEEVAQQVHLDRLPTWKNPKHGQQWINTLRDYAFPKIGRMPVDSIGQPEVLMCISPIWTEKHETARRLSQRIKSVLDVAKSKGFRDGENPMSAIKDARVLPKVNAKPNHHAAMRWQDVPSFYADLKTRNAMAAKALMFTCLTGSRTSEVLGMRWDELNIAARLWTCPESRMKRNIEHRVPLTLFLCDSYPEANLSPAINVPERSLFLQTLVYFSSSIQIAFQQSYRPYRFADKPADEPSAQRRGNRRLRETWQIMDDQIGDNQWTLGDQFSAADIYMFMLTTWLEPSRGQPEIHEFPNVKRIADAVKMRPSVQLVYGS